MYTEGDVHTNAIHDISIDKYFPFTYANTSLATNARL